MLIPRAVALTTCGCFYHVRCVPYRVSGVVVGMSDVVATASGSLAASLSTAAAHMNWVGRCSLTLLACSDTGVV